VGSKKNKKLTVQERLDQIAGEIRDGKPAERFYAELDALLETQVPASDTEADEAWTNRYRSDH